MKVKVAATPGSAIERTTTMFERHRAGAARTWTVTTQHEHGAGVTAEYADTSTHICDPRLGYRLGRITDIDYSFDPTIPDHDRDQLKAAWLTASTYGIDATRWAVEEDYIKITGPATIELIQDADDLHHM